MRAAPSWAFREVRARIIPAGHLPGPGQRTIQVEGGYELARSQAVLVRGPEALQRVQHRVAGRVTEATMSRHQEHPVQRTDLLQVMR